MADPSRSEPATQRRKQEARKRGQVARSGELTAALVLLAILLFFRFMGAAFFASVGSEAASWWGHLGPDEMTAESVALTGSGILWRMGAILGPLLLLVAVVAIAANVGQIGVLFTTEPLTPNVDHLNPVEGFQRVFSQRTAMELVKGLTKIVLITWVVWASIRGAFQAMLLMSVQSVPAAFATAADLTWRMGLKVVLVLLALAILDYAYQRYAWERSLRMTRQEVKDEYRQMEGDPLIKARIRQLQREASRRRMIAEVPGADVVITNPVHVAVAIKYEPGVSRARTASPCTRTRRSPAPSLPYARGRNCRPRSTTPWPRCWPSSTTPGARTRSSRCWRTCSNAVRGTPRSASMTP
jgi:flagellar biosynthetic protein FlhB